MTCPCRFTRRTFARLLAGAGLLGSAHPLPLRAQNEAPAFSYPMGMPERPLGDGMLIRHGYATENTWYNPGWWHTGEDWYLADGDSAGLGVYAVAAGEVVFAGSEYPGLVAIVAHEDGLYSMYGHLDYALAISTGDAVERGQLLGTVLARTDGRAPSHLHFELRTFLTLPEVNGDTPRYGVFCGVDCPPGPGYWPMAAPEHPSVLGWRNPTHVINRRTWPNGVPDGAEVVVSLAAPAMSTLWTTPAGLAGASAWGELAVAPGDRFPLLAFDAGAEDTTGTSAEAYRLWYQIALPHGESGWVRAVVPSIEYAGSDGRAAAVRLDFLPQVATPSR